MYLTHLKEEQEIENFISKGVYPERLAYKHVSIYLPKMEETETNKRLHTITEFDTSLHDNLKRITDTLNTVEIELKANGEREKMELNESIREECPICMDHMGERNYIVPVCGHKICMKCFVTNITTNRESGCLCSLCREKII